MTQDDDYDEFVFGAEANPLLGKSHPGRIRLLACGYIVTPHSGQWPNPEAPGPPRCCRSPVVAVPFARCC
jgi:hypothetical protein